MFFIEEVEIEYKLKLNGWLILRGFCELHVPRTV